MSEQTAVEKIKRQRLQRRMAIQRGVEQAMNRMIRDMRILVDDTEIPRSRMEKHQLGNVLAVALETPSIELVKNFIFYQVGRDTRGDSWRRNGFGDKLVQALNSLKDQAKSIAGDVHRELSLPAPADQDVEAVWIELARQYLGQLNRYFYAKKEVG